MEEPKDYVSLSLSLGEQLSLTAPWQSHGDEKSQKTIILISCNFFLKLNEAGLNIICVNHRMFRGEEIIQEYSCPALVKQLFCV